MHRLQKTVEASESIMRRCPLCNERWDVVSRFSATGACKCKHRNEPMDILLEGMGTFDWITPISALLRDIGKVERFDEFGNKLEP